MIITAGIAVENSVYHFDKIFDYTVPRHLIETAKCGCRVTVPFGRGNRTRQGIILYLKQLNNESADKYKNISAVLDEKPVLSKELIDLVYFMKERYFCSYYDCVKTILPIGLNYKISIAYSCNKQVEKHLFKLSEEEQKVYDFLYSKRKPVEKSVLFSAMNYEDDNTIVDIMVKKSYLIKTDDTNRKVKDASVKMVRLTSGTIEAKVTPKQQSVIEILQMVGGVSVKEVCYFTGITPGVVETLVKNRVCEYFQEEVFRTPIAKQAERNTDEILLTGQQTAAYEDLISKCEEKKPFVSLLYGVTGSGKTSVFMKVIDKVYADGKGVIVMVPEISLTPQMINLFSSRYGDDVAVFHSGLSLGERLDEWKRVKNGQAKIAVGTRSAVFAPFEDLGLIIMDEEQEYTYKSESTPRYHARDIAKFRCAKNNCLLLLSSATPSVDTFYNCKNGNYGMNVLSERYGTAQLPMVIIADMNEEQETGNTTGISSVLAKAIEENLNDKKQSILLINRRGHNTAVSCRNCKEVVSCPNCSISLTYHSANNRLMCHYCGYSQNITNECPTCHSNSLNFSGMGTQMAEQTIAEVFPKARILRLDTDATMSKYSYEKKLQKFAMGEYDIMVGTQMVAKGLNFPNVTLVGVLSIDQMLYNDDYRSYERTFSLLTQVVGRSGRGEHKGRAIIQTYTPENPTILLAANQDYNEFYKGEVELRKAMLYPPFADICMVGFVGENAEKAEQAADFFTKELIFAAKNDYGKMPLRVLGVTPANIMKISNKYRYKLVLKCRNSKQFREMISRLLIDIKKDKRFNSVTVFADVNPDNIL